MMRKVFLWAVTAVSIISCRKDVGNHQEGGTTEPRAVVNMNPLAGKPADFPVQMAVVSTVAGGNFPGYQNGSGGNAQFSNPRSVAADAAGNVYVADATNRRIRKMTPSGEVTTYAGDGQYQTKDGPALSASFKYPMGVAVDAAGNVYVADGDANRIRKIAVSGMVTTVAGSDTAGFADGPGARAKFHGPTGVAVDAAGMLYVADYGNNCIRRISTAGIVTRWCGSTIAGFADGAGAYAQFNGPVNVAVAPAGIVYVADFQNNRIRKISAGVVTTLAGSGAAGFADGAGSTAKFNLPMGVATDATGNVYVTDDLNNRLRKVTSTGVVSTLAGQSASGFRDGYENNAQFDFPCGIVVDGSGNIYVADADNNRIRKIVNQRAVRTVPAGKFHFPSDVALDGSGNLYVNDDSAQVFRITPAGARSLLAGSGVTGYQDGVGAGASFIQTWGLAADRAGNVYIPDVTHIRKITPQGVVTTIAGDGINHDVDGYGTSAGFRNARTMAVDTAGNLYVAEDNGSIRKISPAGMVTTLAVLPLADPYGRGPVQPMPFAMIAGDGILRITCPAQNRMYDVSTSGGGVAGQYDDKIYFGAFRPVGVLFARGNFYFTDNQTQVVWASYVIHDGYRTGGVLAGKGSLEYADGPEDVAGFSRPAGMAADPATGIMYIVDTDAGYIRMMSL